MIAALGFLAATLSIAVVWPQVWLSCRHGRTLGLSPTGSWLAVALNLCWLTFGLLTGDPAQIVTHAVVGTGNTAVLAALLVAQPQLRSGRVLRRTASGSGALVAVAALPQLVGILFDRTRDLSGMSPARWYLGAASCTTWTSYGLLLGQPTVWLSAGFGLVCATLTCAVLRARRPPAPFAPVVDIRPAVAAGRPAVSAATGRPVLAAAA
jgi:uncharacterized protein with PQ loop repeat